nr:VIT1/CCC1 transporter family protein [Maliibacterium massiliense]
MANATGAARPISGQTRATLLACQRDEITGSAIYAAIARRQKHPQNKALLARMAQEEQEHADMWRSYTGKDVRPRRLRVWFYVALSVVMGFTFVLKRIQKDEQLTQKAYARLGEEVPEALDFMAQEDAHEEELIGMLDEERLQYVGAMVLGLNDALVELTGTIAGMTFALLNTRLVALSGIITGISATLSMAASNYLAERASGNKNALKSSLYTGIAYLITVALLVLPYLLFPNHLYVAALAAMLGTVIVIILFFNYYISVAKSLPFGRRFAEMAGISLTVAAISFVIGLVVKHFLGIDI